MNYQILLSSKIPEKEVCRPDRIPQGLPPTLKCLALLLVSKSRARIIHRLAKVCMCSPQLHPHPATLVLLLIQGEPWRSADPTASRLQSLLFERLPMAGRVPASRMHVPRGHGASCGEHPLHACICSAFVQGLDSRGLRLGGAVGYGEHCLLCARHCVGCEQDIGDASVYALPPGSTVV